MHNGLMSLTPVQVVQVAWCVHCKAPVMTSLMADAESPSTFFELLYTRLPAGHRLRAIYDNACNSLHYFLNREAEFCELIEWYIDELHFKGHKACCIAYDTGMCDSPCFDQVFSFMTKSVRGLRTYVRVGESPSSDLITVPGTSRRHFHRQLLYISSRCGKLITQGSWFAVSMPHSAIWEGRTCQ